MPYSNSEFLLHPLTLENSPKSDDKNLRSQKTDDIVTPD